MVRDILTILSLVAAVIWCTIRNLARLGEVVSEWKRKRRNPRDTTRRGHLNHQQFHSKQKKGEKEEQQQEQEHQKLIETESPREIMNPLRSEQEPQASHLSLRQNSSILQEDQAKFCNSTPISSSPLTGSSPLESPSLPVQPATMMTSTLGMKKVE